MAHASVETSSGKASCKLCGQRITKDQTSIAFYFNNGAFQTKVYIHNNPFDCNETRQSLKDLLLVAGGKQNA